LTLLDMVFSGKEQGSPKAEKQFLQRLHALIPADVCPILVTDAGFRTPWFRAVEAQGWHWLGRLRGRTRVKPVGVEDHAEQWVDCRQLHVLASQAAHELPLMQVNRSDPITCRLVVYAKLPRGRKHRTRQGDVARNSYSRKAAAREREPWLIVASPSLSNAGAKQLVNLYARRMQIESSFRDLKSHRYGQGFEDSLTRSGTRLQILLLVGTLAAFASWLAGLGCEATGIAHWLMPARSKRKLYSTLRVGRECAGQELADGACLPMAGTTPITTTRCARSDGAAGLKTWGYLSVRGTSFKISERPRRNWPAHAALSARSEANNPFISMG
jgi:hypothetical protein